MVCVCVMWMYARVWLIIWTILSSCVQIVCICIELVFFFFFFFFVCNLVSIHFWCLLTLDLKHTPTMSFLLSPLSAATLAILFPLYFLCLGCSPQYWLLLVTISLHRDRPKSHQDTPRMYANPIGCSFFFCRC